MKRTSQANPQKKMKKTFSLSPESVHFLKKLSASYRSDSEALDAIISETRQKAEKQKVNAAITSYYDSLSDAEREENRAWGEFAESQFSEE